MRNSWPPAMSCGVGCGDRLVDTFNDLQLCGRCWRALGTEHQARAFEHPTMTSPV